MKSILQLLSVPKQFIDVIDLAFSSISNMPGNLYDIWFLRIFFYSLPTGSGEKLYIHENAHPAIFSKAAIDCRV